MSIVMASAARTPLRVVPWFLIAPWITLVLTPPAIEARGATIPSVSGGTAESSASADPAAAPVTSAAVDQLIEATWKEKGLTPSPETDDATFLRRLSLDLRGVQPSVEEQEAFLADTASDKRGSWTQKLLQDPLFDRRWAQIFRHALLVKEGKPIGPLRGTRLDDWLAERLSRRLGLDRVVREVVTAEGTPLDNPPVTVFLQFEDSYEGMASHLSNVFLGVKVSCAQCHDHPFEKWTQKQFYGLTAFFARTERQPIPSKIYPKLRDGTLTRAVDLIGYLPERSETGGMGDPMNRMERLMRGPIGEEYQRVIDRLQAAWARAARDPDAYHPPEMKGGIEHYLMGGEMPGAMGEMMREKLRQASGGKKGPAPIPAVYERADGEIEIPREEDPAPVDEKKGRFRKKPYKDPVPPRFLDREVSEVLAPETSRRQALADWMTAPENPYFSRAMVNRVWAQLMGRGLVEPVDNIVQPDDAIHRTALDQLAPWFARGGYDLRGLIGLIVRTKAYQRSSTPNETNVKDEDRFSRALVRRLDPEQICASILEATRIEDGMAQNAAMNVEGLRTMFERQFMHSFDVDEPDTRSNFDENLNQALFILNGAAFNKPLKPMPGTMLNAAIRAQGPEEKVRLLTRAVLARDPTTAEIERLVIYVHQHALDKPAPIPGEPGNPQQDAGPSPGRFLDRQGRERPGGRFGGRGGPGGGRPRPVARAFEDILWAMIASTEFLVNH